MTSTNRPNYVYYFEVGIGGPEGKGEWKGHFSLKLTSWRRFLAERLSLRDRFLVIGMAGMTYALGKASIFSKLQGDPGQGDAGVVTNFVRITKLGLPMYTLNEEYTLHPDGRQVHVSSRERFGPIPFLFNGTKEHPAEILEEGMASVYYMPLLGTDWVARYRVRADRTHIDSVMTCAWGQAEEVIDRAWRA